ncbi:outer membrane lipoprotein carrier protein LolA [Nitrospirota bacterium]
MRPIKTMLISAAAILLICAPSWAGPVEDLSELQKGLKSVRVAFKQKKHTELLPRPVKSRGTFYFSQGSGVRWEYDGQMVVIYDNSTLYLHYTEMGEAEKVDGIAGFNGPLSFNVVDLQKNYDIRAKRSDTGDITLTLVPEARMPFASMLMSFRKGKPFPYEVRVREESGDETVISFEKPELNNKLKKSLFVFKPPARGQGPRAKVRINDRRQIWISLMP